MLPESEDPFHELRQPPPIRPRWRRWLPAIVALAAMVFFGGLLVYAYILGGRGADDGTVPVLQADTRPTKVRPENPGGLDVPFQDQEIYQRLGRGGAQPAPSGPRVERLLPPPEAPLPRPAAAPPPPNPPIPSAPDVKPPADAVPVTAPAVPPPAAVSLPKLATSPRETPAQSPNATQGSGSAQSGAVATRPSFPATVVESKPSAPAGPPPAANPPPPAKPAEAAPPAQEASAALPAAGGGQGARVQLGALRTNEEATREGERLKRANSDVLGNLAITVVQAELGARGTFFRIQAGPLADTAAATELCQQLAARKVGCIVVRP